MNRDNVGQSRMYWIHVLSPLHVGAGRGIGFIDLPIVREKVTGWPYVPGSALKGVVADYYQVTDNSRRDDPLHRLAFGLADDEGEAANSGSLVFSDAHLVCLPVRSLFGTFAWCSSPLALRRLKRDLDTVSLAADLTVPDSLADVGTVLIPEGDPASVLQNDAGQMFFEDLNFAAAPSAGARQWCERLASWVWPNGETDTAWRTAFCERFAVVHDGVFDFLSEMATQVDARVKIDDDTKTVAEGQLWYEESLPQESILAGFAWCGPVFGKGQRDDAVTRSKIMNFCDGPLPLQLGGKATVGRGRVNAVFTP